MKYLVTVCIMLFMIGTGTLYAQDNKPLGIGITAPDPRALLHLESSDKALYLPRLTSAQRNAQTGWKAGMLIYNTTDSCVQKYNGLGWKCLGDLSAAALDTLSWLLKGNTGTDSVRNFIGTIDNVALNFKINNTRSGSINMKNTAFGYQTLGVVSSGIENTAVGVSALSVLTTGNDNAALGYHALTSATGSANVAVGSLALGANNNTGNWNNAIGYLAMNKNTTGSNNNAFGSNALLNNLSGSFNVAVGYNAIMTPSNAGRYNTGIGLAVLDALAGGAYNIAMGANAGNKITTGNYNIVIGSRINTVDGLSTSSPTANYEMNIGNTLFGTLIDTTTGLGRIGINTNNPQSTLHVHGQARIDTLPSGVVTDSVVTADASGNLHRRSVSDLSSSNWHVTGNVGTSMTTNFLGTTDGIPLIFRINNLVSGSISFSNTSLGYLSFNQTTSSSPLDNVAIGIQALRNLTYGFKNTAVGNNALADGGSSLENTAIGYNSMKAYNNNNPAMGNTAVGAFSMESSVIGIYNTAIGNEALRYNLNSQNTAVGSGALGASVNGLRNTAIGFRAMGQNVSGMNNVAIGALTGQGNITTGSDNIVIGVNADVSAPGVSGELSIGNLIVANSSGQVGIGTVSLAWPPTAKLDVNGNARVRTLASGTAADSIVTADANGNLHKRTAADVTANNWHLTGNAATDTLVNFIGTTDNVPLRFRINNTHAGRIGIQNTSFGYLSLPSVVPPGNLNTAFGSYTLQSNTTGFNNTAMGFEALQSNTTGTDHIAMGFQALQKNTTGTANTAIGSTALLNNTTGNYNTAIGYEGLQGNTTGIYNVSLGYSCLRANTTGNFNTAIGTASLQANVAGDGNTAIGTRALQQVTTSSNTAIGASALETSSTGQRNTAVGNLSLYASSTGNDNTAIGTNAFSYGEGDGNTVVGSNALNSFNVLTARYNNTAVGYNALTNGTAGTGNTAIGANTNVSPNNLTNATAIGTGVIAYGSNTVTIGGTSDSALGNLSAVIGGSLNKTAGAYSAILGGSDNKALGSYSHITGSFVTAADTGTVVLSDARNIHLIATSRPHQFTGVFYNGYRFLYDRTDTTKGIFFTLDSMKATSLAGTGDRVVIVGPDGTLRPGNISVSSPAWVLAGNAGTDTTVDFIGTTDNQPVILKSNSTRVGWLSTSNIALGSGSSYTGNHNIAIGVGAAAGTGSGNHNISIGVDAGSGAGSGNHNVSIGVGAGASTASGNENIMIGTGAGNNLAGGGTNIMIGPGTNSNSPGSGGQLNIGNILFGLGVSQTVGGTGSIGLFTNDPTAALDVNGRARVRNLQLGAVTDSIVTTDVDGNLRKRAASDIAGTEWYTYGTTTDAGSDKTGRIYRTGNTAVGTNHIMRGTLAFIGGGDANTIDTTADNSATLAGNNNLVSGDNSAVLAGQNNTVAGNNSLVLGGVENVVLGDNALAGGFQDSAKGNQSLAMGYQNVSGESAVAMGYFNKSLNNNSIAVGSINTITGITSIAMGTSNTNDANNSVVMGNANNITVAGEAAVALGSSNLVSATNAVAMGSSNQASGDNAVAMGFNNQSAGNSSVALGIDNLNLSDYSFTVGYSDTVASGSNYAVAMGNMNKVSGMTGVAIGFSNKVSGATAIGLGNSNLVSGSTGAAIGFANQSSGAQAVAMGRENVASADNSFTAGILDTTTVAALYSVAMGNANKTSAPAAAAIGFGNKASGDQAIAMGTSNIASGLTSVAIGYSSQSLHQGSFVFSDHTGGGTAIASTAQHQFTGSFSGGYRFLTSRTNTTRGLFIRDTTIGVHTATPEASLDVKGSMAVNVSSVGGTYNVLRTDYVLIVPSGTTNTINLPAASQCKGRVLIIKTNGSAGSSVNINTTGVDTFEGTVGGSTLSGTAVAINNGTDLTLISDGVSIWYGN